MIAIVRAYVVLCATAWLAACGGGGGGGSGGGSSTRIALSPASVAFNGVEGGGPPAPQLVRVSYSGAGVVVGYAPGVTPPTWLTITQQGSGVGSVDFLLSVTPGFVGSQSTSVRFATGTASGGNIRTADLPVSYTVTASDLAIAAAPTALRFDSIAGGAAPAAQSLTLTFNGTQSQLLSAPAWLAVTPPANPTASPATFTVRPIAPGLTGGTYAGSLVFQTVRAGTTVQRQVSVTVEHVVTEPFDASAPALAYSALNRGSAGTQPGSGYPVTVRGTTARWRASTSQPWLRVLPASGSGPGTLTVTADASGLGVGTFSGSLTIVDDASGQSRRFDAVLEQRSARLTVSPAALSFAIDRNTPPSGLVKSLTISDELGGTLASEAVSWSVAGADVPWLAATPASGSSVPATQLNVSLKPAALAALAPGSHAGTLTLRFSNAQHADQTLNVPVQVETRLPQVTFVAPYVGLADVPGTLILRGQGFDNTGSPLTVRIGAYEAVATPDSETQITVPYPALPAGRHAVGILNAAGAFATRPELVVVTPPTLGAQSIEVPGPRRRLVWDSERNTLYAANTGAQQIERFRYAAGVWSVLAVEALPGLTDLELTPDGRSLIALTRDAILEFDLSQAAFDSTQRATNPNPFCGGFFDRLVAANHGQMFVVFNLAGCSGFTPSYLFDLHTGNLRQNSGGHIYNGLASGSADGSRIYAGSNGVSPAQPVKIYSALDDSLVDGAVSHNLAAASISGNASRVILQNREVYGRTLAPLGNLPGAGVALASRDSTKAFVYRDDGDRPRIEVYDLRSAASGGDAFPLLRSVPLPALPNANAGEYATITLVSSRDDASLFVSGNQRLLVVPVN